MYYDDLCKEMHTHTQWQKPSPYRQALSQAAGCMKLQVLLVHSLGLMCVFL